MNLFKIFLDYQQRSSLMNLCIGMKQAKSLKILEILPVPCQYIFSLMNFFLSNKEKFQTNPSVHSVNTTSKHQLHRPIANLSCFQKSAFCSSRGIFSSLPYSAANLKNKKAQFKVALRRYLNAHSFYSVDEFLMCTDKL
jgi:hypothetical protein